MNVASGSVKNSQLPHVNMALIFLAVCRLAINTQKVPQRLNFQEKRHVYRQDVNDLQIILTPRVHNIPQQLSHSFSVKGAFQTVQGLASRFQHLAVLYTQLGSFFKSSQDSGMGSGHCHSLKAFPGKPSVQPRVESHCPRI